MKTNKTGYTLRAVVAAYVIYLAVGLIKDVASTGDKPIIVLIAIPVFLIAGGGLMFLSVKGLLSPEEDENPEVDAEDTTKDNGNTEE